MKALLACAGCGSLAFALSASAATPTRAVHDGTWAEEAVRWEGRWASDRGVVDEVVFAAPLPAQTEVIAVDGTVRRDAEGRVVAVDLLPPRTQGSWELVVPQASDAPVLAVPLIEDPAAQRVRLEGRDFTPAGDLGFEKHLRYWALPGLESGARRGFEQAARRSGWDRADPRDQAVYLRAEPRFARAGGIPGRLTPEGHVSLAVQGLLMGAFAVLLALGALLYRSLDKLARAERNRAYIRKEFVGAKGPDPADAGLG